MKEYLFIISTKAGSGNEKLKNLIESEMKKQNMGSITIKETKHENHAKEMADEFSREKGISGIIIVCGGDGTLNEIANVLAGRQTAMGVLPTGTANDFSKSLYKDLDIERILQNFRKGFVSPIDLIKIKLSEGKEQYCLNVLSFGFDTLILKEAYNILEKHPKLKARAYYAAIIKSLVKINHYPYELDYIFKDKKSHRKSEYILGALCNGSFYGNGFQPNPQGKLNNGEAFFVLLEKVAKIKIPPLILKYKKGRHIHSKDITNFKTERGSISSPENILCNIDGEIYNTHSIEWTVEEKILPFFHLENHHLE